MPFQSQIGLLQLFIAHRDPVVERLQGVLNALHKPTPPLQDRALLARQFEDCFFTIPGISREQSALRGQLQQAHWAAGFKPRDMPGIPNEMFDPADMLLRACNVWRHTRWPGRNCRVHYAHMLFNLHVVRCLTLLDMRLGDSGPGASLQLAPLQSVLDALWKSSPAGLPVLVRDVRWLVPVAQSPTTDDLGPYFEVARKLEECLPAADCLEIHKASVLMAGGHLRSQLRHFTMQGSLLDDKRIILRTRGSNALDCAMTMQHLVPLLQAYEQTIHNGDGRRGSLADVICQGISSDPDLFVNHLDLLAAYSMIEHLFVVTDDAGHAAYSPMGLRHARLVQQYSALITRLAKSLHEDCAQFRPVRGTYSPYGVMYGFSSNILEHMTLKALQPDAEIRFSLEDVFTAEPGADKLAWVSGWRKLPHVSLAMQKVYEYPQQFAEAIFDRIENALRSAAEGRANTEISTGRLIVMDIAELPAEYVLSSDPDLVAAHKAQTCDPVRLQGDRLEGMYLVSYQTAGGWVAITKDVLTEVLATGCNIQIGGLPNRAAQVLELLYSDLIG